MKIGFIGAGGTGKTTTAKALADILGVPFMQSPSRSCFEKHGVVTEDAQNAMTSQQRLALQMDIFEAIDQQVWNNEDGIFERTHLDNFFYLLFRCHDIVTREQIAKMGETTYLGLQTFDALFYAPIYNWNIKDGIRTELFAPRLLCASFAKRYLEHNKFEHYDLPDSPTQDRVVFILKNFEERS